MGVRKVEGLYPVLKNSLLRIPGGWHLKLTQVSTTLEKLPGSKKPKNGGQAYAYSPAAE